MNAADEYPAVLPAGFGMQCYGVDVRLAAVEDSAFILSLRTHEKLARFIHATENDLAKQEAWMRAYKERERAGREYYFIYSSAGVPYGTNRIYDIQPRSATCGSWICRPGISPELPIISTMILRDIMFSLLGFEYIVFDVRKQNKSVQRMHKMLGAVQTAESELDFFYRLTAEDYWARKGKILKLMGIDMPA